MRPVLHSPPFIFGVTYLIFIAFLPVEFFADGVKYGIYAALVSLVFASVRLALLYLRNPEKAGE